MLCLSGFELYSRWVPLFIERPYTINKVQASYNIKIHNREPISITRIQPIGNLNRASLVNK